MSWKAAAVKDKCHSGQKTEPDGSLRWEVKGLSREMGLTSHQLGPHGKRRGYRKVGTSVQKLASTEGNSLVRIKRSHLSREEIERGLWLRTGGMVECLDLS